MTIENNIVYVDKITSGKGQYSVFSFCFKGEMINKPPFIIKPQNNYYNYNHHLDEEDLNKIHKTFLQISPYLGGSINSYIASTTNQLYKAIISGEINKIMSLAKDQDFSAFAVKWVGDIPENV